MRFLIFLILFSFSFSFSFSNDCSPGNQKQKRICKKLNNLIKKENYFEANKVLRNLEDFPIYNAFRAEILWLENKKIEAKKIANQVLNLCEDGFPTIYYLLAEMAYQNKEFVICSKYLQKSIDLGLNESYKRNAIRFLPISSDLSKIILDPVSFKPKVVNGISTESDEYLPIISPDQDLAFFTRRFLNKNMDNLTSKFEEKFIMSKRDSNSFEVGFPMSNPFNLENNEGGASITIGNDILYYTKCSKINGNYNNCDIFYVIKNNDYWSEIKSFNRDICPVDSWDSQPTVSSDGLSIIFASDRSGGLGGIDLYEIKKQSFGQWSDPVNLGENINSNKNEKSPFLHTDGQTLFFSSNQHPSLGGYDIFYSRKDSFGDWQKPLNIGYPINSSFDEVSLFVSTDGETAYFASNQLDGVGGWDIYSFPLYDKAKPKRVLFLKGDLKDANGDLIMNGNIEIKNVTSGEEKSYNITNGKYVAAYTLEKGDDVVLSIKKKDYSFKANYVSAKDSNFISPSTLNFNLEKLENGKSFIINDINFGLDSYELNSKSDAVILELSKYLAVNTNLKMSINGFTDSIGLADYNIRLSEERAEAVFKRLINYGVDAKRMKFKGYGELKPKYFNDLEKNMILNRRTELEVIGY